MVTKIVAGGIGSVLALAALAVGLILESLIPGAIITLASSWSFVHSVLVAAVAQLAVIVLILAAALALGIASLK